MADKNPISLLQERTMRLKSLLPVYEMESIGTMEVPRFKCKVKTLEVTAEAEARNKKDAKQKAAENALVQLGYKIETSPQEPPPQTKPTEAAPDTYNPYRNYIGFLNEYASGNRRNYPEYQDLFENGQFKSVCRFVGLETVGLAPNKKEAKRLAAFKMMELVKTVPLPAHTITTPSAITPVQNQTKPEPVELDSRDKIIMEKFAELSISVVNKSPGDSLGINMKPHPQLKKKTYSIEEAGETLLKLGYGFDLKRIQSDPYIVACKLSGKEFTLIAFGDTEAEATKQALNDSINVIREGCSGFVPDRNLPMTL